MSCNEIRNVLISSAITRGMNNVFTVQNSSDWQLPVKSCLINFSLLQEIYCKAPFRSFSIKYVCNGKEKYHVNGNKYNIYGGQYLLANHYSEGFVEIGKPVKGICIDVAPDLLSEVVASYRRPDTEIADIGLDIFFNSNNFFENQYDAGKTFVGEMMRKLDDDLNQDRDLQPDFTREFYFNLAERIVADHIPVFKELHSTPSVKSSTKKELYRRILISKEYIDNHFIQEISIATLSKESRISEYHFYRNFKLIFGLSPLQYIIRKRLQHGSNLIKVHRTSITETALLCGFTDVYSFSKAFKKHFGHSPSKQL